MNERVEVWKHDCIKHGEVTISGVEQPCDPRCQDPWRVDAPYPHCDTFATFEQAVHHADAVRKLLAEALKGPGNE